MVLRAKEIMHTDLLQVDRAAPVLQVARQMAELKRGYALVVDSGQPVAIATEWDFIARVLAAGLDPATTPIATIASRPLISCEEDTPTDVLVHAMAEQGIRRMLVTQRGRVVGLVTSKEVLAAFQKYVDQISSDIARLHTPPA